MAIFKIWSKSIEKNGTIHYRTEFIDTQCNQLFEGSVTESDVKRVYEGFWNISQHELAVYVDRVERVVMKSRGANFGIKMLH